MTCVALQNYFVAELGLELTFPISQSVFFLTHYVVLTLIMTEIVQSPKKLRVLIKMSLLQILELGKTLYTCRFFMKIQ